MKPWAATRISKFRFVRASMGSAISKGAAVIWRAFLLDLAKNAAN
jgi:hypothetical protein